MRHTVGTLLEKKKKTWAGIWALLHEAETSI